MVRRNDLNKVGVTVPALPGWKDKSLLHNLSLPNLPPVVTPPHPDENNTRTLSLSGVCLCLVCCHTHIHT